MSSLLGALLIDKPPDWSSHQVLVALKQQLDQQGVRRQQQPALGHTGTLDPFATGLLMILVGDAVKLARYFLASHKTYEGTLSWGATTASLDPTTPCLQTTQHLPESLTVLQQHAAQWIQKPYWQIPPMYSAKKQKGIPLYQLARQGKTVDRAACRCKLFDFQILSYEQGSSIFSVHCSAGTYIRTLASDFAQSLGSLAYLKTLRRTTIGPFQLKGATSLEQLCQSPTPWPELPSWVSSHQLLQSFLQMELEPSDAKKILQGQQGFLSDLLKSLPKTHLKHEELQPVALFYQQKLIAIASISSTKAQLERVFPSQL